MIYQVMCYIGGKYVESIEVFGYDDALAVGASREKQGYDVEIEADVFAYLRLKGYKGSNNAPNNAHV